MVCQRFHATQSTGMGYAKWHLRAKWCDSQGVLDFGQCKAITWWNTSQVQPASYLGTPAQELHLSQVPCPWWGGAGGESPGIPQALRMPVSHIHPFFFPSHPHLEWMKSLPAWAISFETYVPIQIDLKKLWEDQAGLTISLLTMMGFATQTQNKKIFW